MFEELLKTSKSTLLEVDTYLSFTENQLGRAAVTRLHSTRSPMLSGSVTYLHGPAGVGKTHLALWTLNQLSKRHPQLKFAYASVKDQCDMLQRADESQMLAELLE